MCETQGTGAFVGVINRVTPHHHSTCDKFLFTILKCISALWLFLLLLPSAFELSFTEAAKINSRPKGENFGAPGLGRIADKLPE